MNQAEVSKQLAAQVCFVLASAAQNFRKGWRLGVAFGASPMPASATLGRCRRFGDRIGLENFPEGAAVSGAAAGGLLGAEDFCMARHRVWSTLAAVIGAYAVTAIRPAPALCTGFCRRRHDYVVVEELIPERST